MQQAPSTDTMLRATGIVGWLAVLTSVFVDGPQASPIVLVLVGLAGFLLSTADVVSVRARQAGYGVQAAAAAGFAASGGAALGVVPFVVAAALLPILFTSRGAVALGLLQLLGSTVLALPLGARLADVLASLGFQGFAFAASAALKREAVARAALAETHAALISAQRQLAEAHRTAERLHIARELHDRTGHLLTALVLRLEVAVHADEARARSEVAHARQQAKDLLREVREVVAALRDTTPFDLRSALVELAAEAPEPRVELELSTTPPADAERSVVLLRCAQEGVTNARRHAKARVVRVCLSADGAWWVLKVSDDGGPAAGPLTPGAGLLGLEERLASVGGSFEAAVGPTGVTLTARVPGLATTNDGAT